MILCIETATNICSVALCDSNGPVAVKESRVEKSHAKSLSLFIMEILGERNLETSGLDAVAVSMGPGSYTGLRIGVSIAKGIAYASKIPLVAVNTLESMYYGVRSRWNPGEVDLFCPVIDARRMEVYSALFDRDGAMVRETGSEVIGEDSYSALLGEKRILFFGTGAIKCKETIRNPNARFDTGMLISASSMSVPAWREFREKKFADVAYFEPFYLKDFIATIPRKNLL